MKNCLLLIILAFCTACGAVLQQQGQKNYRPNFTLPEKKYNDYQYDFLYLANLVEETFPQIDSVFPNIERGKLKTEITQRLGRKDVNDLIFLIQSRRYLSHLHNSHTTIQHEVTLDRLFPFVLFFSQNKWYLLNISREADSTLIGQEVIGLNGQTTEKVMDRLKELSSAENDIGKNQRLAGQQSYNKPQILAELGILQNLDSMIISFADGRSYTIRAKKVGEKMEFYQVVGKLKDLTKRKELIYDYEIRPEFAYLQFNSCFDKIAVLEGLSTYVKPLFRPFARTYIKGQFRKKNPSERIKPFFNPKYPIFKDFLQEFFSKIQTAKVENLVIDLRYNGGGDFELCSQLLYYLTDRQDLKNSTKYLYSSDIYKAYSKKEYEEFEKKYQEKYQTPVPNKVLFKLPTQNIFANITNPNSPYFVAENRPVFRGKIWILANQHTGSAAALWASLVQDNQIGTLIGTSVANNPTGATTYTPFQLPKTKAKIEISSTYQERADPSKGKIQIPDIWYEPTLEDWFLEKDRILERIGKK